MRIKDNKAINVQYRCEGDLVVTFVTPLIARVDLADLAGKVGVPLSIPCASLLKLCVQWKRVTIPTN